MSWSASDLTTIETAIASGTARVKFADGREVEYRSISDLLNARDAIKNSLSAQSGGVMATYAKFNRD